MLAGTLKLPVVTILNPHSFLFLSSPWGVERCPFFLRFLLPFWRWTDIIMLMLDEILDRIDFCFDNDRVWALNSRLLLSKLRFSLALASEADTIYVQPSFEHELKADHISIFHDRIFFVDIHYICFGAINEYIEKKTKESNFHREKWALFFSSKNKEINKETTLLVSIRD